MPEDHRQAVQEIFLLTAKPVMYVANVDEKGLGGNEHVAKVEALAKEEGAEVVLTTEVLLGTRRDAYGNESVISIPLPPRMILTDREGTSAFSAVLAPRRAKAEWKRVPGIFHRVKATWHTMSAEAAIEKPPAGPVILILQ